MSWLSVQPCDWLPWIEWYSITPAKFQVTFTQHFEYEIREVLKNNYNTLWRTIWTYAENFVKIQLQMAKISRFVSRANFKVGQFIKLLTGGAAVTHQAKNNYNPLWRTIWTYAEIFVKSQVTFTQHFEYEIRKVFKKLKKRRFGLGPNWGGGVKGQIQIRGVLSFFLG